MDTKQAQYRFRPSHSAVGEGERAGSQCCCSQMHPLMARYGQSLRLCPAGVNPPLCSPEACGAGWAPQWLTCPVLTLLQPIARDSAGAGSVRQASTARRGRPRRRARGSAMRCSRCGLYAPSQLRHAPSWGTAGRLHGSVQSAYSQKSIFHLCLLSCGPCLAMCDASGWVAQTDVAAEKVPWQHA